jgi:prepilin-type processing-associated H-X9-DG protein
VSYEFFFLWWPGAEACRLTRMKGEAPLGWDHDAGDPQIPNPKQAFNPNSTIRNHVRGNKTLGGNVVYADGHAAWQEPRLWEGQSWPAPATKYYHGTLPMPW